MTALHLEGVGFTYRRGRSPALVDLDLQVQPGEWVGVLGATGAGKSTLAMLPNGLIPRFMSGELRGRITLMGRDRSAMSVPETAAHVGLVMEDFEAQIFQGRVDLEVAFAPESLGLPRDEIGRRIAEALEFVGLAGLQDRSPLTLSGGQRQRLVLASVLAGGPPLLVLDEPWSDLDPAGHRALFTALRARGGGGILTASDPHLLEGVDRLVLLAEGRIVAEGPPDEVLRQDALLERAGMPLPPLADLFRRLGRAERPQSIDEAHRLLGQVARREPPPEPAPPDGEPVLEVRDLSFRYPDGVQALQGVSFALGRGEVVALLGHNGSGKSTLARQFVGLLRPTSGSVRVNGRDASGVPPHRLGSEVGYIFQNPDQQIFSETLRDEVAFGPRNLGCGPEEVDERVEQALATVGLGGRHDEDPFSLPRGDRQRLAVASALAARPGILVFDEPTTGLDPRSIASMMELVEGLAASGHTVLFITHSMEVAARYARRVLLLEGGRLLRDGPAREVLHDEEALQRAGLEPSPLVALAARLGVPVCRLEDLLACLA